MKLRIAQVRAYPTKGDLEANHVRLMRILDGYMSTETHVTKQNIVEYAIDPASSPYSKEILD